MKVCFIHPDLGIGGAERLIVDAAAGLVRNGHEVVIYTSYHDREHCFEETKDGTLDTRILGNSIFPSSMFGNRFRALLAYLRNLHLASVLVARDAKFDVIVVDQISTSIPILKLLEAKILFYCHFPDKLLTQRASLLKMLYRWPIDNLEEWTTSQADKVVVNSRFTFGVFKEAFPTIQTIPEILYPGIHTQSYEQNEEVYHPSVAPLRSARPTILSINRFERKKNIGLAIRAFACLIQDSAFGSDSLRLIVAGGYDPCCIENVEHLQELEQLASELGLKTHILLDHIPPPTSTQVVFLPSFSTPQRTYLLASARCLVYTPSNEHFGIVPIEAMYVKLPVVAVNSGGPRESVQDGETGFLVEPEPRLVAEAILQILSNPDLASRLGNQGRERVQALFSSQAFDAHLLSLLQMLASSKSAAPSFFSLVFAYFVYWLLYPFIALKGEHKLS